MHHLKNSCTATLVMIIERNSRSTTRGKRSEAVATALAIRIDALQHGGR